MTLYYMEPRDPLVIRDGRPNQGRSESAVVAFPHPSTMAGMVRTRLGSDDQGRFVSHHALHDLLKVEVRGPLAVDVENGTLYAPAPADCLLATQPKDGTSVRAIHPMKLPAGTLFDEALDTMLVGLEEVEMVKGKPPKPNAALWSWDLLEKWLCTPAELSGKDLARGGLLPMPVETRVHVKLGATETAEEGMLFASSGVRFSVGVNHQARLARALFPDDAVLAEDEVPPASSRTLAMAVDVGDCQLSDTPRTLAPGLVPGGGERRLCRWLEANKAELPSMPEAVVKHVEGPGDTVLLRVMLLTPAVFRNGWRPGSGNGELLAVKDELKVSLRAASVARPITLSGWDFAARQPKATRRAAAAGSVYWIELHGKPEVRLQWAREVWMNNISDEVQDRRDGFGLAMLGVGS